MKKAIIYTRAEIDLSDCSLVSIEAQLRVCKEFADKNGLQIAGVWTDIIAVGTVPEFAGWKAIVKDRKPDYGYVLVHDYARIGRNIPQAIKDRRKLKGKGVRIVSATESLDDEYDEALFELLSEFIGEETKKC